MTLAPLSRHHSGMLDAIWATLVLVATVWACLTGRTEALGDAIFTGARSAVDLAIGLVGAMAFFLGLMKVAFDGGLREAIARAIAPLLRRLFPEVPAEHTAMSAMVMNLASTVAGLGNAATPFGLKAMEELQRLSTTPGVATDAMVLFVAINASAVTLLPPLGTIAVRAAAGSTAPAAIWGPTLIATTCSTLAAVAAHYALRSRGRFRQEKAGGDGNVPGEARVAAVAAPGTTSPRDQRLPRFAATGLSRGLIALATFMVPAAVLLALGQAFTAPAGSAPANAQHVLIPAVVAGLLLVGLRGRVPVYQTFIEGAREGLEVALRIVPYLIAMLCAIAMLRASGLLDATVSVLRPMVAPLGIPAEVLPMALLRPLSGSGAFAVMAETLRTHGPDSFIGLLVSTIQGSTETTFYVLAIYFGAAQVRNVRHALACGLIADVAGFAGAVVACRLFFGTAAG